MKQRLPILLAVSLAASLALAQLNPNYQSPVDVMGAHNNHGRGCVACHTPHSGPQGNGLPVDPAITGNLALWGERAGSLAGTTITFAGGVMETLPANEGAPTPDLAGLLLCLTCHDGNIARGAMMTGTVDWIAEGLTPTQMGYASSNVPTWLGLDTGVGNGGSGYAYNHPVGLNTNIIGMGWAGFALNGTTSTDWVIANGTAVPPQGGAATAFASNYGFTVRPAVYASQLTVMCTTCHNQHVMTVYKGTIATVPGFYQTQFGILGYYAPNLNGSNSISQFCRQCHADLANETNNTFNIHTQ